MLFNIKLLKIFICLTFFNICEIFIFNKHHNFAVILKYVCILAL